VRWRAGQVALGLAGLLAVAALFRPLGPHASGRLKLVTAVALGLGVVGAALLSSLRGRGQAELLAFYGFLTLAVDGLGQVLASGGWPVWPLMAILVAGVTVAEPLSLALGVAALASLLAVADAAAASFAPWRSGLAAVGGYTALALAVNRALLGEKRRLASTLAELARIKHGIDHLDDNVDALSPVRATTATAQALRQVSEEGRRARQLDRASELDATLSRIVHVARMATSAHAVLHFDVDRQREAAYLRAADGPAAILPDTVVSTGSDPFAFVLERGQAFYATDFKRLLWSLPYYKGQVKIGTLLALPVRTAQVVTGVLVADRLEIQAFTGEEPALLEAFAAMAADAVLEARASLSRDEVDAEFKAVYPLSQKLATLSRAPEVRHFLLRAARNLVALDGGAVVMTDELQSRYVVEECHGWTADYAKRVVGISEKTWAAWVLRSAEDPFLLDDVAGHEERMPFIALDEGADRGKSLLAVPLRARDRALGALILTGPRGVFSAASARVLGILANQAAATLAFIHDREGQAELAARDGLTGLYNRRAFGELLGQSVAREERQKGRFALMLLDLDHFKKLNDTYGHPAGDAALRSAADVLGRHLRKGDQAARYGGEEFVAILPGTDEEGALHLAERVRVAVEKHRLVFEGARIQMTASFGLAVWPQDGQESAALLAAADRALYAAKQGGRNRVAVASSVPAAPPAS
jgi:diguanylate cyclase (GGDEF)-like protein